MKSDLPLDTAAIFFLAHLFLIQGIISEYVTVDFICKYLLDLFGTRTANYKGRVGFEPGDFRIRSERANR